MIIILTGASHTGKTLFAQKLTEKYHYPCLSADLLKMGLIRSDQTDLTPEDDEKLVPYLWNIMQEIIKTALENGQNLIVEGCYVPFSWKSAFAEDELRQIRFLCLTMSPQYITEHYGDIKKYASVIEKRHHPTPDMRQLIKENNFFAEQCSKHELPCIRITDTYPDNIEF